MIAGRFGSERTIGGVVPGAIAYREKIVYLSDPNGSDVFTVGGCTTSATKSSRQEASDSFDYNSTVDGVIWWRRSS